MYILIPRSEIKPYVQVLNILADQKNYTRAEIIRSMIYHAFSYPGDPIDNRFEEMEEELSNRECMCVCVHTEFFERYLIDTVDCLRDMYILSPEHDEDKPDEAYVMVVMNSIKHGLKNDAY